MDRRIFFGGLALLALSCATGAEICNVVNNRSATQVAARQSANGLAASQPIVGPGSHVDVTAFGAKGDGVTDDTDAIQAAIDFGCSHSSATIFFPPVSRFYKVMQTQRRVSETAPIFRICKYFHALETNSGGPARTVQSVVSNIYKRSPWRQSKSGGTVDWILDRVNSRLRIGLRIANFCQQLESNQKAPFVVSEDVKRFKPRRRALNLAGSTPVANLLSRGKQKHTMRESEVQIENSLSGKSGSEAV